MATPVYSRRFLSHAGLNGTGSSVVCPPGHVYVVKQITTYASPLLGLTAVFFEDELTGGALFSARFQANSGGWVGFYGAITFEEGEGFHFQVNNSFNEGADLYAGGYDLTA
jgi:hypothetical protein